MWRVLALFLAVGVLAAADDKKDPKKAPEKKDEKKEAEKKEADKQETDDPEGTWTSSSITDRGKQVRAVAGYESIVSLKKDGTYTETIHNQVVEEGTYKTNPSKSPKEIDMEVTKGPDKGKKKLGIYELKGDTLKLTVALAGEKERPAKFEGDKYQEMVFSRKKK